MWWKRRRHRPTAVFTPLALVTALSAGACSDESSPLNVVPSTPAGSRVVAGDAQTGRVGEPLADSVVVVVTDRFGNPVPGAEVGFAVVAGDGEFEGATETTSVDGLAGTRWVLGTAPGDHEAEVRVADLGARTLTATALAGPPAIAQPQGGDGQVDTVDATLSDPLVVAVTDAYGNPLPGVEVEWSTRDRSGTVQERVTTTDSAGRAVTQWTLGPDAGRQWVTARVAPGVAATFEARVHAGTPEGAAAVAGDEQEAASGTRLPDPLVVAVHDRHGNGVPDVRVAWSAEGDEATVEPAMSMTDGDGTTEAVLTLGADSGDYVVVARPDGMSDVTLRAVSRGPVNLSIDNVYLTQASQRYDGTVPLVAGRDAYFRVFVVADLINSHPTTVRAELYDEGVLRESREIEPTANSVPVAADEASLDGTWNVRIPGDLIVPGLEVLVRVDPADEIVEREERDNAFPASGAPLAMDVRSLPPFEVRFVPVHIPGYRTTGDVDEANADDYLDHARRMFPIPGYDADVHAPFTTTAPSTATPAAWDTILSEVDALRVSEGSSRYYYGVIANSGGSPYCGFGYYARPAAVGLDGCGASTAAHEWGHNFDRRHAPCGGPTALDPDYPYSDGSIGVYGMDAPPMVLKRPDDYADLMSYCRPRWISDYTYTGVLDYRESEAAASPMAYARTEPTLLVWGRVGSDGLALEPAIEIDTRPVLPEGTGPYEITGLDETGQPLFRMRFRGHALAHGPADARHFAFAIPLERVRPSRLARLRLSAPGRPATEVVRTQAAVAADADPRARTTVERLGPRTLRLRWDPAAYPLVVPRHPRTGQILAFGRGGSVVVRTNARELDLLFGDGIGTTSGRISVSR